MDDGIGLADIAQELVAQAFAFGGALYEAGNVHNLHRGGHDAVGVNQFCQLAEALIGHGDNTHVGLDGAEGEVG